MGRLYYSLTLIAAPLVAWWLRRRLHKGKEDAQRLPERFGYASTPRPAGTLIWIHAASVGESNSVIPLLAELSRRHPDGHLLVTTGTVSSSETIAPRLPANAFHQFVPVDTPQAVGRFLAHWKPDLAIWVESEFWPNLVQQTCKSGARMMLVNARMSDRSFAGWKRRNRFFLQLANCFDICFAGSAEDAQKYRALGVSHTQEAGNLKYDTAPLPVDDVALHAMQHATQGRRIILASSTHEGEEESIEHLHDALRGQCETLLTIIVPRHAPRGDAVVRQLASAAEQVTQRSRQQPVLPSTQIYVADTMGELGLFYRLADIVVMGGSLVPHGGHNPIEPAQLGCSILCGPHMHNFISISEEMQAAGALKLCGNIEQIKDAIVDLWQHPDRQQAGAQAAIAFARSKQGAVLRIADAIDNQLAPVTGRERQSV